MSALPEKPRTVKSLLISATYYPPDVGGISKFMSSVVRALGPDRVCCLMGVRRDVARDAEESTRGVYRRPLAFASPKYLQAVGWGAALAEIMMRERPKAVQLATVYEGNLGLWLRKWLRLPYVVYAHGNEILDAAQASWDGHREAIRSADCVFANSRFTVDLLKQAGVTEDRIEIVHPGCDVERFRPISTTQDFRESVLGPHASARVILTVGRLVSRKGHDLMILALPMVLKEHPDTCYLIVGSGPAKSAIEELSSQIGIRDRVIFLENVEDANLPRIYNLCDLFVMPSRADLNGCDVEGFGIVFLEANACGKPVIAGRSGGIADAVLEGRTGLLVSPDSPEALAEAVCRVLGNKEYAKRLGQQGRQRAVREFGWGAIADRVDQIMMTVASGGGRTVLNNGSIKEDGGQS